MFYVDQCYFLELITLLDVIFDLIIKGLGEFILEHFKQKNWKFNLTIAKNVPEKAYHTNKYTLNTLSLVSKLCSHVEKRLHVFSWLST